jgi:hypothetical protein
MDRSGQHHGSWGSTGAPLPAKRESANTRQDHAHEQVVPTVKSTIPSSRTDFHSAMTAAIDTLKELLHGGANEEAMKLIARFT